MAPVAAAPRSSISTPRLPVKSALSRSAKAGTVRTLEDAGFDRDSSPAAVAAASPAKRQRVTFDPSIRDRADMEVVSSSERDLDLEVIRIEVRNAIKQHIEGDSENYDLVKELFSETKGDRRENAEGMRTYVLALTSCVSLLGKNCSGLVQTVINYQWAGKNEAFVKAYLQFLGNLVSAQGAYTGAVLHMLVEKFNGIPAAEGRQAGQPMVSRVEMTSRVHSALKYLLRLIPSASGRLSQILGSKFPYPEDSNKMHVTYINNLLKVMEYAPELKTEIFALITEKLVKLDVQMHVDLEDLDADIATAIVQSSLQLNRDPTDEDQIDDDDSDTSSVASDDDLNDDEKRTRDIRNYIEKMDSVLDILFTKYSTYFADANSAEAGEIFEMMLAHFANIILPTYRSHHTQFLLFHFAQMADHLVDGFTGACVSLIFRSGRPAVLKQSAAAYLASFVARGAHVPADTVRQVFDLLASNLDVVQAENELTCRGPDLQRFGTFYAMTQALLYIFCFRWRDLIVTESETSFDEDDETALLGQDLMWVPGIKEKMSRVIYSRLNPLKICSPSIVEEFAKIARHLRFLYVYPLLETNKRVRLSQFVLSREAGGAIRDSGFGAKDDSWHQLDAYFPFDPYQLPVSKRWLEGDYIQWRGIPGLHGDDEDDDDSEEEEDDDDDDEDLDDLDTATDEEE